MQQNYSKKIEPIQKASKNTASSVLDASSQSEALQRKADMANNAAQREEAPRPNNTGMPDNLKSGIESLSGFSMDDVRVHYNSSKPATVQALAYTQGTDIHVAPGQEKHLPHEAWHVAQQMAGRVSPTTNINGMPVNDNAGLEHEADVMGEKAVMQKNSNQSIKKDTSRISKTCQMIFDEECDCGWFQYVSEPTLRKIQSNTFRNLWMELQNQTVANIRVNEGSGYSTKIARPNIIITIPESANTILFNYLCFKKVHANLIDAISGLAHEFQHASDFTKGVRAKINSFTDLEDGAFFLAELNAWNTEAIAAIEEGVDITKKVNAQKGETDNAIRLINGWIAIKDLNFDSITDEIISGNPILYRAKHYLCGKRKINEERFRVLLKYYQDILKQYSSNITDKLATRPT